MKTFLLTLISVHLLFTSIVHAQNTSEQLDINNINATIGVDVLFSDAVNGSHGFEFPKGSGKHTIFAGNLWVAGLDVNGQLKGYAETYASNTSNRRGGPIMDPAAYSAADVIWDRVWKVNKAEVQNHMANYASFGYVTPEAILTWPAHGDTSKSQALNLAPFFDADNDGVYDPSQGDYPIIKGDQSIYFIYNDVRASNVMPDMQVEIHGIAYAYDCSSDSAINNTIFLDYKLINRSTFTSLDTYIGLWADTDIGNAGDDYIGSDVARSTFYAYNGDAIDENNNNVLGYGDNPPAQGITFLKGVIQDADGTDNPLTSNIQDAINMNGIPYSNLGIGYGDGIIDNEYYGLRKFISYNRTDLTITQGDGDPVSGLDYYNYLRGTWRNGSQMVWGGNGNPVSGGTVAADIMFPDNSDPLNWSTQGVSATPLNWSEFNAGSSGNSNLPNDRRGVGATGPFTFEPNEEVEITLSFTAGIDYQTTGNLAGISVMQERIDSIHSYFRNNFSTICGGLVSVDENEGLKASLLTVYPNPFNDQLTVNYELENNVGTIEVYNLIGEQVLTKNVNQNQTTIDLNEIVKGIYFIQVIDGNNRITQKIVKQ